ncbi:MAG TPA: glycosyltransferase family 39 protein, partial [Patescibacteria group bacterium]|nr:glycosyltransferase family 39 protein [Patescibacteria group bacterium]
MQNLYTYLLKTGPNAGFLLFGITLLGTMLRFWALDAESYWLDETASAIWASGTIAQTVTYAASDVHPPLYFVLLGFWGDLFGRGDFALRGFSAVVGIMCIPGLFLTARELFKKDSIALASTLLLAVSPFHLQFSQEARSYTMMCFGAILCTFFFFRLLQNPFFKNTFFYLIAALVLLYTHLFGSLFIATHAVFFLFFKRKCALSLQKWSVILIALFIAFLPWSFVIRRQMEAHKQFWISSLSLTSIPQLLLNFSGSLTVWGAIALVLFSVVIFHALWQKRNSFKSDFAFSLLVLWFVIPVIIAIATSVLLQPVFMPRFLIGTLPAFLLLATVGIDLLQKRFLK